MRAVWRVIRNHPPIHLSAHLSAYLGAPRRAGGQQRALSRDACALRSLGRRLPATRAGVRRPQTTQRQAELKQMGLSWCKHPFKIVPRTERTNAFDDVL